jgi:hypothetical protein
VTHFSSGANDHWLRCELLATHSRLKSGKQQSYSVVATGSREESLKPCAEETNNRLIDTKSYGTTSNRHKTGTPPDNKDTYSQWTRTATDVAA